jgi:NADH-quinone oxidoreductase subunit J
MLTVRGNMNQTNLFSGNAIAAGLLSLILIGINALMVLKTKWPVSSAAPPEETVDKLAELMLTKYVVPFEVVAVLLLIALIGAVIIAKEVKKTS